MKLNFEYVLQNYVKSGILKHLTFSCFLIKHQENWIVLIFIIFKFLSNLNFRFWYGGDGGNGNNFPDKNRFFNFKKLIILLT